MLKLQVFPWSALLGFMWVSTTLFMEPPHLSTVVSWVDPRMDDGSLTFLICICKREITSTIGCIMLLVIKASLWLILLGQLQVCYTLKKTANVTELTSKNDPDRCVTLSHISLKHYRSLFFKFLSMNCDGKRQEMYLQISSTWLLTVICLFFMVFFKC